MKKRLEAELISIAHRILKLKNKSELIQLHRETQKLYEALSVLKFVEENMGIIQPQMNVVEIEEKLAIALDEADENPEVENPKIDDAVFEGVNLETEPELKEGFDKEAIRTLEPEATTELEEIVEENSSEMETETAQNDNKQLDFEPHFEITEEEEEEEEIIAPEPETPTEEKKEVKQISFEDFLGENYSHPVFEKLNKEVEKPVENDIIDAAEFEADNEKPILKEQKSEQKPAYVVDASLKTITFGLNDKIGFEKQLFAGSSEEMNRVVSQLSTFDSLDEAQEFIEDMVKPDYNNWEGKEDYELRFMEIVAKKFA